ncbi:5'-3' exoribonuclease 1 [Phyllostomus discolor]|uniref:5'-3' exoribonuclease 1 n=1 Tax=Phyllostomus discolor TaxID=89673 RepID=A0A834EMT3_9CHIR|nr:5'-3' exoribonuclease 1 [Phyllostomus discolor]
MILSLIYLIYILIMMHCLFFMEHILISCQNLEVILMKVGISTYLDLRNTL